MFLHPKPIHRPDLVLMVITFPVQGPKDKRGWPVGAALGYLYLISTPLFLSSLYFCPAPQIDPILIFMKSKVRSLWIKFNSEYVLTDFAYLSSCKLWIFLSKGNPPTGCRICIKIYYPQNRISPAVSNQFSPKFHQTRKKHKRRLFQSRLIPVNNFPSKKHYSHQGSVFHHFGPKIKFLNWCTVSKSVEGENIPCTQNPVKFNRELCFSNSISGQDPNSKFPDFYPEPLKLSNRHHKILLSKLYP
jgi:hypothetical protein